MQAQEAAPGFLPDPYINLGNRTMTACTALTGHKRFPKHLLDAFYRIGDWVVRLSY